MCELQHLLCAMTGPMAYKESGSRNTICPADTELDWVAYMQEVEGFMKVRPFSPHQLCKASATASSANILALSAS